MIQLGARYSQVVFRARVADLRNQGIQVVLRRDAGIDETAYPVELLLAAVEAAFGRGHHFVGLLLGNVLAVHGVAQHSQILSVAQSVLGLLELYSWEGAGFDQCAQALDSEARAKDVGVFRRWWKRLAQNHGWQQYWNDRQ